MVLYSIARVNSPRTDATFLMRPLHILAASLSASRFSGTECFAGLFDLEQLQCESPLTHVGQYLGLEIVQWQTVAHLTIQGAH